jgi:ribonuclease T2
MVLPACAFAQAISCKVPDRIETPDEEGPRQGEQRAAPVSSYLLSLSWSPEFCRKNGNRPANRWQCSGQAGQFGFILHGLWPDAPGRADPAWCAPAKPISRQLVRQHFCMTPSPKLLQHEWARHGTCATESAEKYFKAASVLYGAIKYPDMAALSFRQINVAGFAQAFARANPGLRPNMFAVKTNREAWLEGVNICLDLGFHPRACAPEDRGARPGRPLKIWLAK